MMLLLVFQHYFYNNRYLTFVVQARKDLLKNFIGMKIFGVSEIIGEEDATVRNS